MAQYQQGGGGCPAAARRGPCLAATAEIKPRGPVPPRPGPLSISTPAGVNQLREMPMKSPISPITNVSFSCVTSPGNSNGARRGSSSGNSPYRGPESMVGMAGSRMNASGRSTGPSEAEVEALDDLDNQEIGRITTSLANFQSARRSLVMTSYDISTIWDPIQVRQKLFFDSDDTPGKYSTKKKGAMNKVKKFLGKGCL